MKFPNPFDKKYRWILIGGLAVVFAVIVFGRRSSASGQSGGVEYVSSGPGEAFQIAAMQTGAQLTAQQNELRAIELQSQTQLALNTQAIQGEIALAGLDYQARNDALAAEIAAINSQLTAQQNLAQIEAGVRSEETRAYRDVNLASIASTQDMFAMQIQGAMHERSVYADIMNTAALSSRDVEMTRIQAETGVESLRIDATKEIEGLRILTERDTALASIEGQVTLGLDDNLTQRTIAAQQAKTQKRGQTLGFVGSLIGGIASIFSDVRVKNYIRQTGELPNGMPWYEWNISGFTQAGVMAQQAMEFYPENINPHYTGLLTVDYGFLGDMGANADGP
jgi:hypothetical protein